MPPFCCLFVHLNQPAHLTHMASLFGIALGVLLYWIGSTPTKQTTSSSLSSLNSPEAVILPLNIKRLWEEGVPEGTEMLKVHGSHLVWEFRKLGDDRYMVCLCDEVRDIKRVVNNSASWEECQRLKTMAFGDEKRLLTNLKF